MPFCAPQVVASVALTGQTSTVSQTLYTPSADGVYRFTVALRWSLAVSPTVHATVTWTLAGSGDSLTQSGFGVSTVTDSVDGGNAITLTTTYTGPGAYDVYAIVEQLA